MNLSAAMAGSIVRGWFHDGEGVLEARFGYQISGIL